MTRPELIETLARAIASETQRPLRVGIDGIDCAGKTTLANELKEILVAQGIPVIRASIDGFHYPRHIRVRRGLYSPEGYFHDSFDYLALTNCLLAPFAHDGNRRYRSKCFDYLSDVPASEKWLEAPEDTVLIMEGVFLFRETLVEHWDVRIFVDITFEECLRRARIRDLGQFGSEDALLKKYLHRYIPGQKLYFASDTPQDRAHFIMDNNDVSKPLLRRVAEPR